MRAIQSPLASTVITVRTSGTKGSSRGPASSRSARMPRRGRDRSQIAARTIPRERRDARRGRRSAAAGRQYGTRVATQWLRKGIHERRADHETKREGRCGKSHVIRRNGRRGERAELPLQRPSRVHDAACRRTAAGEQGTRAFGGRGTGALAEDEPNARDRGRAPLPRLDRHAFPGASRTVKTALAPARVERTRARALSGRVYTRGLNVLGGAKLASS